MFFDKLISFENLRIEETFVAIYSGYRFYRNLFGKIKYRGGTIGTYHATHLCAVTNCLKRRKVVNQRALDRAHPGFEV